MAGERGLLMPEIRTAVRTGDTLMHERRAMLKRPPHILVTTPESLYILLTAEKSRAILRDVETVIVDEIHAVADDKRGAHLTLSLERLEALTHRTPVRIGLSATQKPIEEVAHFLTGNGRPAPVIVDVGHKRKLDLAVEVPGSSLGPITTNEMWDEIYNRLVELVEQHRSTLVFVNTRRLAERIAHNLGERLGEENVAAHHGSLSRKLRLSAEQKIERRQSQGSGGHGIAGTGNRYRHRGPGGADQFAAGDRGRAATGRAFRPLARRGAQGTILRRHARRSAGMRRAGASHPAGRSGPADHSRCSVGYSGAADCGNLRGGKRQRPQ